MKRTQSDLGSISESDDESLLNLPPLNNSDDEPNPLFGIGHSPYYDSMEESILEEKLPSAITFQLAIDPNDPATINRFIMACNDDELDQVKAMHLANSEIANKTSDNGKSGIFYALTGDHKDTFAFLFSQNPFFIYGKKSFLGQESVLDIICKYNSKNCFTYLACKETWDLNNLIRESSVICIEIKNIDFQGYLSNFNDSIKRYAFHSAEVLKLVQRISFCSFSQTRDPGRVLQISLLMQTCLHSLTDTQHSHIIWKDLRNNVAAAVMMETSKSGCFEVNVSSAVNDYVKQTITDLSIR